VAPTRRRPELTADDVHGVVVSKPGLGRGRGYEEDAPRGVPATGIELNGRPLGK
jgi:hypothetical protein